MRKYVSARELHWTVDAANPYMIHVVGYVNIEDAVDVTYTFEEVKEMFADEPSIYLNGAYDTVTTVLFLINKMSSAVQAELARIPEGKKSIRIDDDHLVEALKACHHTIGYFAQRDCRRTGDRITIKAPKIKTGPNKNDASRFVYMFFNALSKKIDGDGRIEAKYVNESRLGMYQFIKSLWTWEEVEKICRLVDSGWDAWDDEKIALFKVIYDNPEKFC
jgi:hypothetical protein